MNQILEIKNSKEHKSNSEKDIAIFLIIMVIILGFGLGGYYIYQNIINGNIKLPIFIEIPEKLPVITLTQTDRDKLIINIQSEDGIEKVTYSINNSKPQEIEAKGKTFVEKIIIMPVGENKISVFVSDMEGKETSKKENFIVENIKPVIDLSVVGYDIKIIVTSEVELSEIKYKWNLENEKIENMKTYENRKEFEKQLEIPIGQNTLTVIAIDVNGSKTEKTQEIKGVTKATITTEIIREYLHFTVKGKENIQKVEFEFNGKKYLMNTETFGKTKTVHYKVKLLEGTNYLTIKSTTQSGGETIETVVKEYKK